MTTHERRQAILTVIAARFDGCNVLIPLAVSGYS